MDFNMMFIFVLFICSYSLIVEAERKSECPPKELTPDCSCRTHGHITLTCYDMINMWDFINILNRLKEYYIYELYYQNLNIQFLPKGFLRYLPIKILMLSDSVILGLETEDGEAMFEGAIESIETFNMHKVEGAKSWRWKALTSLKNLKALGINACDLTQITSDFNSLAKSIEIINFSRNKITQVDDKAFDSYQKLKLLDLYDNEISVLKRSMFPDPAKDLRTIYLGKNKIKELPKGMFTNMPALQNLDLSSNRIQWLSINVFDFMYHQLFSLDLKDNNIYCCKDQEWFVDMEFQKRVQGKCRVPVSLAGRDLSSLTLRDLEHGLC